MNERNSNRVADLPMIGEVLAQLIATGQLGGTKHEVWEAVQKVAPGYLRPAFERHWAQAHR